MVVLTITVTSLRAQENMEDSRWETAVRCIKKYEGWHGPEHHPYVAYGHRIRKGEKFPTRLTESEGDSILRKDLKEMCALFRHLGKEFVDEYIYDIERAGIHSYRYRTKNPMHLLEKIIRKRKENYAKFEHINKSNYHKYITDLIGIRVFFLYREDWIHFHKFITSMFENDPNNYIEDRLRDFDEDPEHCYIAERPKVYKRSGDTRIYDSTQIEVRTGGYYRSLHYIIKYHGYYLEIQGRTLFEEGWSEIDHDIVYPYYKDDEMLTEFSGLLNRLSGMADEMSSYFRKMKELREEEPDKK